MIPSRFRRDVSLSFEGEASKTLTQGHLAPLCGVSDIVSRAIHGDRSGIRTGGAFLDLSKVPDSLQEALNIQIKARDSYLNLPANVRSKYPTPESFFAACHSPDQIEALKALGLCNPTVVRDSEPTDNKPVNAPNPVNSPSDKTVAAS